MAILCRDIGLLFLQAPHTGSTSLGTLLREDFGGVKLLEDRVRDERGRILLRQKHQTLAQLLEAGLLHPDTRTVMGTGLARYTHEPKLIDGELRWVRDRIRTVEPQPVHEGVSRPSSEGTTRFRCPQTLQRKARSSAAVWNRRSGSRAMARWRIESMRRLTSA